MSLIPAEFRRSSDRSGRCGLFVFINDVAVEAPVRAPGTSSTIDAPVTALSPAGKTQRATHGLVRHHLRLTEVQPAVLLQRGTPGCGAVRRRSHARPSLEFSTVKISPLRDRCSGSGCCGRRGLVPFAQWTRPSLVEITTVTIVSTPCAAADDDAIVGDDPLFYGQRVWTEDASRRSWTIEASCGEVVTGLHATVGLPRSSFLILRSHQSPTAFEL